MESSVEGVSPDILVSLLSRQDDSGPTTLVIDSRPFMAFNAGHVLEAVNVHCPPILKRRSGGFVALENIVVDEERRDRLRRGLYRQVVIYDQSTEHLLPSAAGAVVAVADRESNLCSVVKSLGQQVQLDKILYLQGGYDAFSQDCPMLCVTQQFSPLSTGRPEALPSQAAQTELDDDEQPVEILPHLFLGSGQHSSRREALERLGVTALVNVSANCVNHFPASFRYLRIPVRDNASEDLASWFPVANQFIDEVKAEGGKVLVHCHAGRSRSATVCLAYLICTLDLSLDAAFELVRARRQVIDPNLNFMRQLQDYRLRLDTERLSRSASTVKEGPSLPSLLPSGLSSVSSDSFSRPTGAAAPASSGSSGSSPPPGWSSMWFPGPCAIPSLSQTPMEAPAPITLPSSSRPSSIPPAFSAADLPPPSPAIASDVRCFFVFPGSEFPGNEFPGSEFSSSEFFPSSSMARTPEILLPS